MNRQRIRQLAARFIKEAEADINYGLAERLDPHYEYAVLVARLHGEQPGGPSSRPNGPGSTAERFSATTARQAATDSSPPELQPLAGSRTVL